MVELQSRQKQRAPAFDGAKFDVYGYCLKHARVRLSRPKLDENTSEDDEAPLMTYTIVRKTCYMCGQQGLVNHRKLKPKSRAHGYQKRAPAERKNNGQVDMELKRANSHHGVHKKDRTEYRRSSSDFGSNNKVSEPHSPKRDVFEDGSHGDESPNDVMYLTSSGGHQPRRVLDTALVLYEGGMPEPPIKDEPEIKASTTTNAAPRRRALSADSRSQRTFRRSNSVGKGRFENKEKAEKKDKHESKAKTENKERAKSRGRSRVSSVLKSRSKSTPAHPSEKKGRGKSTPADPSETKSKKTEKKDGKAAKTAPPKRMNSANNAGPATSNRYELPFNPATGNCNRHPEVSLAEKNGTRWKIVRDECPKCTGKRG